MLEDGAELRVADAGLTGAVWFAPIAAIEPVSLVAVRISLEGAETGASFSFTWVELTKRCSLAS
jgi:hypothetical protein